mgnify:CR=1 FL=1
MSNVYKHISNTAFNGKLTSVCWNKNTCSNYELTNHLGNVLAVVSDKKLLDTDGSYKADIVSATDYYPYGMTMPGRSFNDNSYSYGFGGHYKDDEVKGVGNWYAFGDYGYDPRIVQRPAPDPKWMKYPSISPYVYCANNRFYFLMKMGKNLLLLSLMLLLLLQLKLE